MTGEINSKINGAQPREWNGDAGQHWIAHQDRHDVMLAAVTPHLLTAAAIQATGRVLDVGCGCEQTTILAARRAARGQVLGVDLSEPMLEQARLRAVRERLTNAGFEQADAQIEPFPEAGFDVALSRFGVMFFDDPKAALANIGRALRPGGRLAFLCWQEAARNAWIAVPLAAAAAYLPLPDLGGPGGPGPFSLADPHHTRELLHQSGFTKVRIEPVHEPVRMGTEVSDVVGYIRGLPTTHAMLTGTDDKTALKVIDAVADSLQPYQTPDGVILGSAAWLVTARR